jgi:hypothetical protein
MKTPIGQDEVRKRKAVFYRRLLKDEGEGVIGSGGI